jgi:hypothetical protein
LEPGFPPRRLKPVGRPAAPPLTCLGMSRSGGVAGGGGVADGRPPAGARGGVGPAAGGPPSVVAGFGSTPPRGRRTNRRGGRPVTGCGRCGAAPPAVDDGLAGRGEPPAVDRPPEGADRCSRRATARTPRPDRAPLPGVGPPVPDRAGAAPPGARTGRPVRPDGAVPLPACRVGRPACPLTAVPACRSRDVRPRPARPARPAGAVPAEGGEPAAAARPLGVRRPIADLTRPGARTGPGGVAGWPAEAPGRPPGTAGVAPARGPVNGGRRGPDNRPRLDPPARPAGDVEAPTRCPPSAAPGVSRRSACGRRGPVRPACWIAFAAARATGSRRSSWLRRAATTMPVPAATVPAAIPNPAGPAASQPASPATPHTPPATAAAGPR